MARILSRVQATRAGNCKKIAQYCQKEAKRAAAKGNRSQKDIQLRSKRATKEVCCGWKKIGEKTTWFINMGLAV